ncbi:MAG: hypothetical protein IIB89_07740 [Chloroflexi bacterium]|nr:hypothetical protein [Chloroflexota bacterium]
MKKKLIPLIGLTLSLAVAGIIMGFTLSGGSGAPAQDPAGQIEEPSGNRPPIRSDESIDSDQAVDTTDWKVATSIDDIDPNVCNLMHNRAPCTAEELGELGMTPTTGSIAVGEYHPGGEVEGPGGAVEGKHEPLFGEAVQTESQSDSGSSGFVYYFSADGEFVCVAVHDIEDGGVSEIKEQIPVMMP